MKSSLTTTALRSAIGGFALTLAALSGIQLHAQAISGHDSRAPVQFDAGDIELQDREDRVVLSGGVIVTQAGLTVRSQRMLVNYSDAGDLSISRITATGGVNVRRGNETAIGDVAVYDLDRRIITMAGNVELRRGGDALTGGRLTIDLASGRASVDGRGASQGGATSDGRVTGTFNVPQSSDTDSDN